MVTCSAEAGTSGNFFFKVSKLKCKYFTVAHGDCALSLFLSQNELTVTVLNLVIVIYEETC